MNDPKRTILGLRAENFKRIEAVEIEPSSTGPGFAGGPNPNEER